MSRQNAVKAARHVPVKVEDPAMVVEEAERVHDSIMKRAFEIFGEKGMPFGRDLENWLAAERELVRVPRVKVRRRNGSYVVEADIAGIEPENLDVQVTPNELLITGETQTELQETDDEICYSEFSSGHLFRRVAFPAPVDPAGAEAVYKDGMLTLTAPVAAVPEAA